MQRTFILLLSLVTLTATAATAAAAPWPPGGASSGHTYREVVLPRGVDSPYYVVVYEYEYHGAYDCYSAGAETWKETNGVPGLQRTEKDGVPADTRHRSEPFYDLCIA